MTNDTPKVMQMIDEYEDYSRFESNVFVDELEEILRKSYGALTAEGDTFKSKNVEGKFITVFSEGLGERRWSEDMRVVTRLPDGRHFEWSYARPLQDDGEWESPEELNDVELCEVVKYETVKTYIDVTWAPPQP